ncbi:methyl-accepting chemotaxis protein, partial [Aneurinibacillus thermoaerophilus]|uniref:methyl-accepting chemotaxis protein n=1 Tax=Aneurinibacillus thermoaerophilus TaxID=143495 RepID=UPI002E1D79C6|nr:methyl-accepting chemotaxis protein [Aneurinibacillus thermoaerophilus]MED0762045.1 methyl-accepting chemotaxis protein [Aneurinibacillus thermoaerophilus]
CEISDNPLIACSAEVDRSETPTSTYGKWERFIIERGEICLKSIKGKLLLSFTMIFLLFAAVLAFVLLQISQNTKNIQHMETKTLPIALKADDMKLSVVQVQQWLTDISVTKAAKGLDDGFDKAEEYAKQFEKTLGEMRSFYPEQEQRLQEIQMSFNEYYNMGKKMAHDYIQGGTAKGNETMGEFDAYAESINEKVDKFRAEALQNIRAVVKQLDDEISFLKTVLLISSSIVLLLSIVIALKISRAITLPLSQLLTGTQQIAHGNLTDKVIVHTKDEIGQLGAAFEQMRLKLLALVKDMQTLSSDLNASSHELSASANQSGEASQRIATIINEVADGTNRQADAASIILEKMEQAMEETKEGHEQVKKTMEHALEATNAAHEGNRSIHEAIHHLNVVCDTISSATESIQKLERRSEEIGGIITTITDISSQTNLLALNAAVEAARAGEHGKGFAVVADEVHKLAEESNIAAKKITEMIRDIQAETAITIRTMESNFSAIEKQVDIIKYGGKSLDIIVSKVGATENNIKKIEQIFHRLESNTQEILQSLQEIATIAQASAAAAQEVASSAEEQSATVEEVAANSSSLAHMSETLEKEMSKFIITKK